MEPVMALDCFEGYVDDGNKNVGQEINVSNGLIRDLSTKTISTCGLMT